MIKRLVRLPLKPQMGSAFEAIFIEKNKGIIQFDGCISVEMWRDIKEPDTYWTVSEWVSEEALNNYRASDFFGDVWPKVKTMLAEKAQAWSLEQM
jgi:quinol monooxygenase YgiN